MLSPASSSPSCSRSRSSTGKRSTSSVTRLASAAVALATATTVSAAGKAGTFEIVGNSGVSAQQMFLGSANKVYIVDKTENNPMRVNGASGEHAAWGSEYSLDTNKARAMDIVSNSFCAGGAALGNGTWLNVGGNQGITWGGLTATSQTGGAPYDDYDGGKAIRLLDPCEDNDDCQWSDNQAIYMTTRRWYPSLETLEDGSIIIIGGCEWGGYVNSANQNNPTYEFFPPRDKPVTLNILVNSLPANLFPFTWLLPSGNLFIQTNWNTEILDYKNNVEYALDDIPSAVRTYPANGAVAMLPLTPANNWTSTLLFCGGTDLKADQWVTTWNIAAYVADKTCVKMSPDVSVNWEEEDSLDTGRTMGEFIIMPDGRLWMGNGAHLGTAGYGNETWAVGRSYADQPLHQSWYFDPKAASGSKWSKAGVSTIDRLYHSTATLLPDGAILVSGSNPNPDYVDKTIDPTITYVTEYQVEKFYPDYYDKTRPVPSSFPKSLLYGGDYFNVTLPASTFSDDYSLANKTNFVVSRTGFSTHAFNMGMRHLELESTYTVADDGTTTFHVSQMPPNAALFPPGPALLFCVVDGVPSQGEFIMVGSGKIETQAMSETAALPPKHIAASLIAEAQPSSTSAASAGSTATTEKAGSSNGGSKTTAASGAEARFAGVGAGVMGALVMGLGAWLI